MQSGAKAMTAVLHRQMAFVSVILLSMMASHLPTIHSFSVSPFTQHGHSKMASRVASVMGNPHLNSILRTNNNNLSTKLHAEEPDSNDDRNVNPSPSSSLGESEAGILGISGIVAASIMIYSESVLFQTGCGLPAGPAGLVGAAEGVSYLGVVGLVGFSLFTKITTGSGLPPGPRGVLGLAEGLSYLAVLAGIFVLIAQVTNFGYIPNAVPMEGGMCS
mmetsp:Transcript_17882/g.27060  ORF Transcript_17882/g.27060 Transcript_17882/m.27060 type:complete len:218 (-) Transcript_17882:188-841(-)